MKKVSKKIEYPECEKLLKVSERSQIIGEFLEWLNEKNLTICEIQEDFPCEECGEESLQYVQNYKSIEDRIADFFGIDMNKVEKERQQMLDDIRKENKEE